MICCQSPNQCIDISVLPQCINLTFKRGTDVAIEAVITDGDGKAFDITLDTITFTVSEELGGTQLFQKSNPPGSHSDPVNGRTEYEIASTDIPDAGSWVYEVRRLAFGGDERVHISGSFTVVP